MLLLASYDIVFQEVPGEVTLALNLSACPNRCPGCHSPHLREAVGEALDNGLLRGLLERYGDSVTCVAFMGGDGDPAEVDRLAASVHSWRPSCEHPSAEPAPEEPAPEEPAPEAPTPAPTLTLPTDEGSATTRLKTAWYSGRGELSPAVNLANLDFIKLGPYDPRCGGLDNPGTNQRFYRIEGPADERKLTDATSLFRKKPLS